jgi:hypothetical protein
VRFCLCAAEDTAPLPGIVGPAVQAQQPLNPVTSEPEPQEEVTAAASADIAQTIPPLYNRMLARHNTFRMRHGAVNLTWDAGLAATAQAWARGCRFQHSPNSGMQFGENLYAAWLGTAADLPKAAAQATNEW